MWARDTTDCNCLPSAKDLQPLWSWVFFKDAQSSYLQAFLVPKLTDPLWFWADNLLSHAEQGPHTLSNSRDYMKKDRDRQLIRVKCQAIKIDILPIIFLIPTYQMWELRFVETKTQDWHVAVISLIGWISNYGLLTLWCKNLEPNSGTAMK